MRVKILARIWNLVWVPKGESVTSRSTSFSKTDRGLTEAPTLKKKRMFIRKGLPEHEELEVILHECLHAADWSKDEEWVENASADIARVLWKMGWRKSNGSA